MISSQEIQPRNRKPSAVVFVSLDTEIQPEQLKLRLERGARALKIRQATLLREVLMQRQPDLVVIPVASPVRTLSRMIAEVGNPDRALEQWIGSTESFLKTLRKNRQRVLLISLEDALNDPDYMAEAIAEYAGVAFEPPEGDGPVPQEAPAGSALDVFAQILLETHPAARETLETLDALVLSAEGLASLSSETAAAGCAAFLTLLKNADLSAEASIKDVAAWKPAQEAATGDDGLALETVQLLQQEIDTQLAARMETEERLAASEQGREAAWAEVQELRDALATAERQRAETGQAQEAAARDHRLALETVQSLQQEIDTQLVARMETEERRAASERGREAARAEVQELAEKLARAEEALAEAASRIDAHGEELELARGTLYLLQQELATYSARIAQDAETIGALQAERGDLLVKSAMHDAQERQMQTLKARMAQREAVLGAEVLQGAEFSTRLLREIDALRQQLADAQAAGESRIHALEGELVRVYGSRSWRVTRPLRGTSRALRGKSGSDERV